MTISIQNDKHTAYYTSDQQQHQSTRFRELLKLPSVLSVHSALLSSEKQADAQRFSIVSCAIACTVQECFFLCSKPSPRIFVLQAIMIQWNVSSYQSDRLHSLYAAHWPFRYGHQRNHRPLSSLIVKSSCDIFGIGNISPNILEHVYSEDYILNMDMCFFLLLLLVFFSSGMEWSCKDGPWSSPCFFKFLSQRAFLFLSLSCYNPHGLVYPALLFPLNSILVRS